MNNLFKAQVRFNGGNPHLFKVRVDVTLKDLKDQLNETIKDSTPETQGGWRTFSIHVRLFADRKDNANRRWLREEHVLRILSRTHVPDDWDESYVAEIAWRYSQEFDSATRLCLGSIIIV